MWNLRRFLALALLVVTVEVVVFVVRPQDYLRAVGDRKYMRDPENHRIHEGALPRTTSSASQGDLFVNNYTKEMNVTYGVQKYLRTPDVFQPTNSSDSASRSTGNSNSGEITVQVFDSPIMPSKRVITLIYPFGRLANKIFSYASFIGIALSRGMEPKLFGVACDVLARTFVPSVVCDHSLANLSMEKFNENKAAKYDRKVESLSNDSSKKPLVLTGYLQSWKYFDKHYTAIKRHLTFQDKDIASARLFMKTQLTELAVEGQEVNGSDVAFVGVHVRRGDMTSAYSHGRGYSEAPKQYIMYAMHHMRDIVKVKHIIFIVTSDDIQWCKANIKMEGVKIAFSEASQNVDLALLSMCNHNIITSGTFGWWGAYLAGGKTIYWKKYPLEGSTIASFTHPADYYYPSWIGIS